ncbi:hypothetical protein niasHS_009775 [Heterodera schachtii]|uniref:Uncharacterized protein n=1 Tax=Heterodera schachtii TaxID=97005 RepID=A0ABD2J1B0_HETSC
MSASSSLFLAVALASLVISAYTLKCWNGTDLAEHVPKNKMVCNPGTVFCLKMDCLQKHVQVQYTLMTCHYGDSSFCDRGYHEDEYSKCDKILCCREKFCNYMPDRVLPKPHVIIVVSGVIGLHTPLGIGFIVFAALIAAIFSAEFVKWF